jgi:hypothetical protein
LAGNYKLISVVLKHMDLLRPKRRPKMKNLSKYCLKPEVDGAQ